jgi:clan AA aspartic protease
MHRPGIFFLPAIFLDPGTFSAYIIDKEAAETFMGNFTEKVTLKNPCDAANARNGLISEGEVRQMTVEAVVDTGASTMVITEEVCRELGLAIEEEGYVHIANGARQPCKRTEPVSIYWGNRYAACSALVIPGSDRNLLGAIPLEDMDLRVNPVKRCLEGANGNEPLYLAL